MRERVTSWLVLQLFWIRRLWCAIREEDSCEGCARAAMHYDVDGVPLCDACWDCLLEDAA